LPITYLRGDATRPNIAGPIIIAHICNDVGKWGAGFTAALDRLSPEPKKVFLFGGKMDLGFCSFAKVSDTVTVANMCAQHGVGRAKKPFRADALEKCLKTVHGTALQMKWADSIVMPRIGCGLSGATWSEVEPIINKTLTNIPVYVYDL
jgi:O-acetyl-ADP-ribose deacetylase (regulator of RNase III)